MHIETSRLLIRQIKCADAGDMLAAMECNEIHSMYSNQFASIEDVKEYIQVLLGEYKTGKYGTMVISNKKTNVFIGTITLDVDKVFPRADISYWIAPSHRNMGYATEAVKAFIAHAFTKMSLNRIQAIHFPDNLASKRVLIKARMQYEGTLRQYVGMGEIHLDCLMYSILKKEYLE